LPTLIEVVAIESVLAVCHSVEHLLGTAAAQHRHAAFSSTAAPAEARSAAARVALVAEATATLLLIATLVAEATATETLLLVATLVAEATATETLLLIATLIIGAVAILALAFAATAPLGGSGRCDEEGRADHQDPEEPSHRPYSDRGENPSVGWVEAVARHCPRRLFITPWA